MCPRRAKVLRAAKIAAGRSKKAAALRTVCAGVFVQVNEVGEAELVLLRELVVQLHAAAVLVECIPD